MTRERPDRSRERDPRTGADAPEARIREQSSWVDLQVRQAVARGDFDKLPGFGKPIDGLTGEHDPDWWVKKLIEREQITGVLPPSLLVRKADAELDAQLDRLVTEEQVRRAVDEFNEQVRWALYRPPEGPPVVTRQRVAEVEVERWRDRRTARIAARQASAASSREPDDGPTTRWPAWLRGSFRGERRVSGKRNPRGRTPR